MSLRTNEGCANFLLNAAIKAPVEGLRTALAASGLGIHAGHLDVIIHTTTWKLYYVNLQVSVSKYSKFSLYSVRMLFIPIHAHIKTIPHM